MFQNIALLHKTGPWLPALFFCFTSVSYAAVSLEDRLYPIPESEAKGDGYQEQRKRFYTTPPSKKAQLALEKGNIALAAEHLERALHFAPKDYSIRVRLLRVRQQLGQWDEALALCSDLLEDRPDYLAVRYLQGTILASAGRTKEAQAVYEHLLNILPKEDNARSEIHARLVELLNETGNYGQAKRHVMAQAESPTSTETDKDKQASTESQLKEVGERLLRQGYLLSQDAQWNEARDAFLRARDVLPAREQQREIEQQLGQLAYRKAQYNEAAKHFKSSLLISYTLDAALGYLYALKKSRQWELGLAEARTLIAQEKPPKDEKAELLRIQADLAMALGRTSEAVDAWLLLYQDTKKKDYLLRAAEEAPSAGRTSDVAPLLSAHLEQDYDNQLVTAYYQLLKSNNVDTK